MAINWTVLTYFVIALFALNGFFRGWWKEAITTALLALLVFFLRQPDIAKIFIDFLNRILVAIWELLPASFLPILNDILENGLGVRTAGGAIQANSGDPDVWLILLLLFIVVASLIGRSTLANKINFARGSGSVYPVTPVGSLVGGLVGGLNGFIVVSLVREYLDGRSLPGSTAPATEITLAGGSTVGMASSGVSIQAVELPRFTILDSFIPWIIIIIGILIFVSVLSTRLSRQGLNIKGDKVPFGYRKYDYERKKEKKKEEAGS